LSYSKDMQEDKEQVFDAIDSLALALAAATGMVRDMTIQTEAMRKAAGHGFSTATDLADWLVRELGMPFREAHHVTGRAVALAEARGVGLEELPLDSLRELDARIGEAVFSVLGVDASVNSRTSFGGTAPANVRAQVAYWRERMASDAG
ncbi:MAG: argininosuccinate lyase, partial [Aurantimonas coralicida]